MSKISVIKLFVISIIFFSLSAGQWIAQPLLSLPGQNYYPVIVDINKDGYLDIVASCNPDGIWFWAGDTAFLPNWTPLDTVEMTGTYMYVPGVGDFNRDGNPDLVCTSWPGLYTWTGDGSANPQWTPQAQPDNIGFYIGCQAKDINHDTICDIVASTSGGSNKGISVWTSDGNTNPNWIRHPAPGPDTTYDYHTLILADVNKDTHLDIVAGHQNDRAGIKVWTGNGGQGGQVIFTAQESPTASGEYLNVAVGDVNNDTNPDIVGAQRGVGVDVWLGDGNQNPHWTAANGPQSTADYWGVALGDLNGDGNLDIVASNITTREIQAWFGNGGQGGNMVWTAAPPFSPSAGYEGITIIDVNRDNKPDVIAGCWSNRGVQVWINNITEVKENNQNILVDFSGSFTPNPFNQKTQLKFVLKKESNVIVKIFDALGRLVSKGMNGKLGSGTHQITWHGLDQKGQRVPNGTYFITLEIEGKRITKPVIYIGL